MSTCRPSGITSDIIFSHAWKNHDQQGEHYFAQWKRIISQLAVNVPGVPKYRQWDQLKY
ncbi:hypothetical protein GF407_07535 [candidate division KSB1 bacterium]|nr:hypothetical protein [candidate division KSB1 bacterium]